jgi:hypothetical protein
VRKRGGRGKVKWRRGPLPPYLPPISVTFQPVAAIPYPLPGRHSEKNVLIIRLLTVDLPLKISRIVGTVEFPVSTPSSRRIVTLLPTTRDGEFE